MLAYLIAGIVLIGSLVGFVAMERKAGADSVRAVLQPKLDACAGEVEKHNAAAKAMAEESAKRQAAASKALANASASAKVWEGQASRLTAVLTAPRPAGEPVQTTCEAAWKAIRETK